MTSKLQEVESRQMDLGWLTWPEVVTAKVLQQFVALRQLEIKTWATCSRHFLGDKSFIVLRLRTMRRANRSWLYTYKYLQKEQ